MIVLRHRYYNVIQGASPGMEPPVADLRMHKMLSDCVVRMEVRHDAKSLIYKSSYQIPGIYLVNMIGRAKNRNHSTWLRFDEGTKLNRRRPIGHERDTEPIIKQGNSLGVRLQERDGNATRHL